MTKLVDLRSDTVTQPTEKMRKAMYSAEVGDDGYGEDPTVNALEEAFTARIGKEAALFVPSGVMGNQIALRVFGRTGTAVVAGQRSHIVAFELGAAATNSATQFHLVDDATGAFDATVVDYACALADYHQPEVSLICVENTHMATGGRPWNLDALKAVRNAAKGRALHMDGARLFNAEVATGIPAATYAAQVTTVMTCLSKGLCAPVGSMLGGSSDAIAAARIERKRLGGSLRQAGIVAAAGLIALEEMVERLSEDHEAARRIGEAVANRWPEIGFSPSDVATNIVLFYPPNAEKLLAHLKENAIAGGSVGPGNVRLVTHAGLSASDIEIVVRAIESAP
jgi:threonine aldolase